MLYIHKITIFNFNSFMIGDRLKYFRKEKQLTQEELADLLCISQSWYSKLESKSEGFTVELIHRIAKVLKIDASQLLNANMLAIHPVIENNHKIGLTKDELLNELENIKTREKEILRELILYHNYS